MGKIHELLAIEKQSQATTKELVEETYKKFKKPEYFFGFNKALSMLKDSPDKEAIEAAGSERKELPTTVPETLEYVLDFWAQTEDILYQKNKSNQTAQADIVFGGLVIEDVPVDELLGLEFRLDKLRNLIMQIPTLDASRRWEKDTNAGEFVWRAIDDDSSVKTQKIAFPVVLYEATKEHPAQVKESTKDEVVGKFTVKYWSGAASSHQKARALTVLDGLILAVKKARVKANEQEACNDKIGKLITDLILTEFRQ